MTVPIEHELREICRAIVAEHKTDAQWAEIESDDMFQQGSYAGGYDADESEFCFSYHAGDGIEYWFQFSLEQAARIAHGEDVLLNARKAE